MLCIQRGYGEHDTAKDLQGCDVLLCDFNIEEVSHGRSGIKSAWPMGFSRMKYLALAHVMDQNLISPAFIPRES